MLREVLPELSTICTAFTVWHLSQRDVTELDQHVIDTAVKTVGHPSASVCQGKGGHFEHKLSQ